MNQLNTWWRDTTGSRVTPEMYLDSFGETLYMVGISLFLGALLGIPLALAFVITRPGGLKPNKVVYGVLNVVVNIIRSLPFIILLVAISPFTRVIAGTAIGTTAALVPLTLYIAPFIARLIEAADSMGASLFQTIRYFLLPEAKSSIILAVTTATIGLISATAMAGTIGGGGVGDLAISYGYQQFDSIAMLTTVVLLIIIVQAIQSVGNTLARRARA